MGRSSKLTRELQDELCSLLTDWVPVETACNALGISDSTYYAWRKRGREEQDRRTAWEGKEPPGKREQARRDREAPFLEFLEATTRAIAQGEAYAIDALRRGTLPSETVVKTHEVFTETRLKQDGSTYEYTRTIEREQVTESPGEWRPALEFLKRRDPKRWSEQVNLAGAPDAPPIPISFLMVTPREEPHEEPRDDSDRAG
ncbi:MAG: hypothetical protein LC130_28535 [Bryobacterales bacterium]|nr:hypothetical protein [Bryobacterales bacterium]